MDMNIWLLQAHAAAKLSHVKGSTEPAAGPDVLWPAQGSQPCHFTAAIEPTPWPQHA